MTHLITAQRKAQLTALGFYVENMGQEHGSEFEGQFRWMHTNGIDFQDWEPSLSEDDAWRAADWYFHTYMQQEHA